MRLSASDWLHAVGRDDDDRASKSINTEAHVIICGYGRSGQNLARLLEREGIPYMALDLDPDRVRQAAAAGQSVVFGDAARLQSLMAAGLARASAVVVSYHDTPSALKILRLVHDARAAGAGDRAHASTTRDLERLQRRRRHRGRARGDRRLADAGQPRAGAGRRADAARDPRRAGPARRALQPAARLLPRRRRRHRRRAAAGAAAQRDACRPPRERRPDAGRPGAARASA